MSLPFNYSCWRTYFSCTFSDLSVLKAFSTYANYLLANVYYFKIDHALAGLEATRRCVTSDYDYTTMGTLTDHSALIVELTP